MARDEEPWDPPTPYGPMDRPPDRFSHLPQHTKEWLAGLSREDVEDLRELYQLRRATSTILRFFRWVGIACAAMFGAMVTFGEGIKKMLGWVGP